MITIFNSEEIKVITCTLNFHSVPTSTPGMAPKWFDDTIVHTLLRPTQAIPWKLRVQLNQVFTMQFYELRIKYKQSMKSY